MWEAPGCQQSHKLLGKSAPLALAGAVLGKEAQKTVLAKDGWNWEHVNSLGDGPQLPTYIGLRCSQVSIGVSYSRPHTGDRCPCEPSTSLGEGRPSTVTGAQTCSTALCCLVFLKHGFPEAQELYSLTNATNQLWSAKVLCENRYLSSTETWH